MIVADHSSSVYQMYLNVLLYCEYYVIVCCDLMQCSVKYLNEWTHGQPNNSEYYETIPWIVFYSLIYACLTQRRIFMNETNGVISLATFCDNVVELQQIKSASMLYILIIRLGQQLVILEFNFSLFSFA